LLKFNNKKLNLKNKWEKIIRC